MPISVCHVLCLCFVCVCVDQCLLNVCLSMLSITFDDLLLSDPRGWRRVEGCI